MDPPVKVRFLKLTDEQMKLLRMWGRGNASAGARWLIDNAALIITNTRLGPDNNAK